MPDDLARARDAWNAYVATLASLRTHITHAPEIGYTAAEGLEHVMRQVVCWSAWEVFHADPTRPFFQRQLDMQTQWGGPNNDNVYRYARISPEHRYRIRGRMHSCEDFVLALRAGFFHNQVWGTKSELTASERGVREGSDFELLLGGDAEGAIPIPDGVIMVCIREYYTDWRPLEPATFTIECLDAPPPGVQSAAESVRRTEAARAHVLDSLNCWHDYLETNRAKQVDNRFPETMRIAKGLSLARYENCYYVFARDEALIIESAVPDARYFSAQVYVMDNFDLVDRFGRITSRNQKQTRVSTDGRIRWVLAAEDPGVANWIDTGGRPVGLCMLRWFWPRAESGMAPQTRVVGLSALRAQLPADEPHVTPAERAAELARRQDHMRWRFRS
jgi:hypothetical protein